jgi:hypothetical protein
MKLSSDLMAFALAMAMSFPVASRSETIVVDSFDGPDVRITDHEGDILLEQNDVEGVLGGHRVITVGGYIGFYNSLEVGGGSGLVTIDSAIEGASVSYGYSSLLNRSFEPDAIIQIDFHSAPWTTPQMFTVEFASDGGDAIRTTQLVLGGSDFTVSVSASDLQPRDPEVNPVAVLNNVDSISIRTPTTWRHSISEIRIVDDRMSPNGDFDFDHQLDVNDVDLLATQIRRGQSASRFDVDANGRVQTADLEIWVRELKRTWFGDANLDGEFNSVDLSSVFSLGGFEDEQRADSTWAGGDWNGDGHFTTTDLVVAFQDGGYEQGPRKSVAALPEPTGATSIWSLLAAVGAASWPRQRRVE